MKAPSVKSRLAVSLTKSSIRILSAILSLNTHSWIPLATGILITECLGIIEELF